MANTAMVHKITPVVLSGGSGSRLWPMSRAGYPKQFLGLHGNATMIQQTMARVQGPAFNPAFVICNNDHRFLVAEQMRQVGYALDEIILEPIGRNTAPAAAIAALRALEMQDTAGDDALLLIMASDHIIADVDGFLSAVDRAAAAARDGSLVIFGIQPDSPETGYGYIRATDALAGHDGLLKVDQFVEKPDLQTAKGFLADGHYFWNSGIFLFSAQHFLDELHRHHPEMLAGCQQALANSEMDLTFRRLDHDAFEAIQGDSIDYTVMEKTSRAAVVPVDIGWNDVGAWSALYDIAPKDSAGNASHGDVLLHNTANSYVRASHQLVAVVGLDDVVVVARDDAVLGTGRDRGGEVIALVVLMIADGRPEPDLPATVHRPWGSYRSIDHGDHFQVKHISVNPGGQLSLQKHQHRAEHWVIVSGTAKVTRGREVFVLNANQSTYIPAGEIHRLENVGSHDLHLIEVQSGHYLGEDDIVRFEDDYGRTDKLTN